jgi:aminoglycoside phosphotransferase (APT) family kinase protein
MHRTVDEFRASLSHYLTQVSGAPATVTRATPMAGGASRDMWRIDVKLNDIEQALVVRRDLPTSMFEQALSREHEFRLMQAAYDSGIKVARPHFLCTDESVLGAPFFIMDYVDGISIGRKVVQAPELARARALLPMQMAEELAKIHQLDTVKYKLGFLPVPRLGHNAAQEAIKQCYDILEGLRIDHPAFEFSLRWAEQNAPPSGSLTFLHGDFRVGNLLVNTQGLIAVADWEFAHMGDAVEELGYCCMRDWRFGMGHLRLGGIADREPFLQAYENIAGVKIDRRAVDFWEFLGNVRWGIICLSQANRHLSGKEPSVEYASLGRRSAEMQCEMLRLIESMGV